MRYTGINYAQVKTVFTLVPKWGYMSLYKNPFEVYKRRTLYRFQLPKANVKIET